MNNARIKSETIKRDSLCLEDVLFDEIKKQELKVNEIIMNGKSVQEGLIEEDEQCTQKKEIQPDKKQSCCYRRCCNCCSNQTLVTEDWLT